MKGEKKMKNEKVYLRKDGRYCVKHKKGVNENGETIYGYIYGKTKEEVLEKKNEYLKSNMIINKSLFSGDIFNWLKSVKISCKVSTYSNYEYTCYAHLIPYFGCYKKNQINKNMIHDFTEKLLNKGLESKTVKDILIVLNQILKYVGIRMEMTMPRIKKKEIQIFSKEEQLKLEKYLTQNLNEINFGMYLCLYTGLRIGEICALKWKNIDLQKKVIHVEKTLIRVKNYNQSVTKKTKVILDDPKSASSIRDIPIPNFFVPLLKKYRKNKEDFLLTGTKEFMEPRSYTNQFKKVMKILNMKRYHFHILRHTFATRCIENGSDAKTLSEILGHANVKITLEKYVHPSFDSKVTMMNHLNPLI